MKLSKMDMRVAPSPESKTTPETCARVGVGACKAGAFVWVLKRRAVMVFGGQVDDKKLNFELTTGHAASAVVENGGGRTKEEKDGLEIVQNRWWWEEGSRLRFEGAKGGG